MTKEEFIGRVLSVLNEASGEEAVEQMIGSDMVKVPPYIGKLYPAAWRRAVRLFPLSWFNPVGFGAESGAQVANAADGTGYVALPDDFLTLYSFRMKGWKTSCRTAQEATERTDRKQANRHTRGTPQRPVCVLRLANHGGNIRKALYYYSLPRSSSSAGHVIEEALYVPNVTAIPEEIDVDDNLIEPLAYLCASTVLTSFEKTEQAKAIDAKVAEMI